MCATTDQQLMPCVNMGTEMRAATVHFRGNQMSVDQRAVPERASSACGQRHGGIPPQRPTDDCEPDSVDSQYMGPGKHTDNVSCAS